MPAFQGWLGFSPGTSIPLQLTPESPSEDFKRASGKFQHCITLGKKILWSTTRQIGNPHFMGKIYRVCVLICMCCFVLCMLVNKYEIQRFCVVQDCSK